MCVPLGLVSWCILCEVYTPVRLTVVINKETYLLTYFCLCKFLVGKAIRPNMYGETIGLWLCTVNGWLRDDMVGLLHATNIIFDV